MKKTLLTIAAVAALASCTKNEVVYSDSQEIGVMPVSKIIPKGGPLTPEDDFPNEMFKVIAFHGKELTAPTTWAAGTKVEDDYYFDWTNFASIGETWAGADETGVHTPKYWPKQGQLFFAGYYPHDAVATENATYTFNTANLSLSGYTTKTYSNETSMDDLMWFDVNDQTSANSGPVPVTFKHALSWITFIVNAADDASNEVFTISSIKLKQVHTSGDFNSNNSTANSAAWSNQSTPVDFNVFSGSQTINKVKGKEGENDITYDGLLIIPQAIIDDTNIIEVNYTMKGVNSEFTYLAKLSGEWEVGTHYTYTLTFGAKEIEFTPSIGNWEDSSTDITVQ